MHIERLQVEGFGQFANHTLDGLRPGIQLVEGPNESGKSTLRRFLRWMLFGRQHGDKKLWTNRHGHLAGSVGLVSDGEPVTIVRHDAMAEVHYGDRHMVGEAAVVELLGGMDLALYDAIFTFDLFDLQQIDALKSDRVQNLLAVGATLGGAVHPADILAALDRDAQKYWRPRARGVVIREARSALREQETALDAARSNAEKYQSLQEQLPHVQKSIADVRRRLVESRVRRSKLDTLVAMWPVWTEWRGLVEETERIAEGTPISQAECERLEAVREARKETLRRAREAREHLAEAEAELAAIEVDEKVLAVSGELEGIADRRGAAEADMEYATKLAEQVRELAEDQKRALERLGSDWEPARVAAVPLDASVQTGAQRHARRTAVSVEQVPAQLATALRAVDIARRDAAEVDSKLAQVQGHPIDAEAEAVEEILRHAHTLLPMASELAVAQTRLAEIEAENTVLEQGWQELGEAQFDELRTWRERWREATAVQRERVAAAERRLDEASATQRVAQLEVDRAEGLPGAEAPEARQVALVETKWPATRDAIERENQLGAELVALDAQLAAQPRRLGGRVDLARVSAVSTGAEVRSRLGIAFEQRALLTKERDELQVLLDEVPTREGPSADEVEQRVDEAQRRRRHLLEAQAALSVFRQARDRELAEVGTQTGISRWLGAVLLVALAVAASLAAQFPFAVAAFVGAVVVATVVWRGNAGLDPQAVAEAQAARSALAEVLAGADLEPSAGEVEILVALAKVRSELDECARQRVAAHDLGAATLRRSRLRDRRDEAERRLESARSQLAALLDQAGVPKVEDRVLAWAWLDVATEVALLEDRRRNLARDHLAASVRVGRFLDLIEPLIGSRPAGRDEIEAAISELGRRRGQASARALAIDRAKARADETRDGLAAARAGLARVEGEAPVPIELSVAWSTWAKTQGVPAGVPDAEFVAHAQHAVLATSRLHEAAEISARIKGLVPMVSQFQREVDRLALVAGLPDQTLPSLIDALRDVASRAAETRTIRNGIERLRVRVRDDVEQAATALREAREADRKLKDELSAFDEWAGVVQAPPGLAPSLAEEWVAHLEAAREAICKVDSARARLVACSSRVEGYTADVAEVATRLGEETPRDFQAAVRLVRDWRGGLKAAREASTKLQERAERVSVLAARAGRRTRERANAEEAWEEELSTVGCADESAWDERRERAELWRERCAERDQHSARLAGALGLGWETDDGWSVLGSGELGTWNTEAALIEQRVEALEGRLNELDAQRGELMARSVDLATDAAVPEIALRVEGARTILQNAEREWWRLQIARHLLFDTFERFRRERQPAVLLRASRWFQVATDGAYEGLEVDDGPTLGFYAKGADRSLHPATRLSTGTTGLLYLCLRLALALDQAAQVRPVPLLLDDVLAHFDPTRARAAARLLAEVASAEEAPQLLLFTCRPETVSAVREADPTASVLKLARWAGASRPPPRRGVRSKR